MCWNMTSTFTTYEQPKKEGIMLNLDILVIEKSPCSSKIWALITSGLPVSITTVSNPQQAILSAKNGFGLVVVCEETLIDPAIAEAVEEIRKTGKLVLVDPRSI
jgi:hypothetical protein